MEAGSGNLLQLAGEIASLEPIRFTPAGIPVTRAVIRHESWHAGQKLQCEVNVAAQGKLAERLAGLQPGQRIWAAGPLSRASQNSRHVLMWIEQLTEE